ncbi:hypothetical protein EYF80_030907 [Liparis tanakae]|uniref:Uncharacterized protein n=1 Tax=Liparis tanakae TaxID=230148 RepID=A0A4Z2GZ32_9TELE|nr:hypothetical protein EYF80_030907 [Liparis tanakae]
MDMRLDESVLEFCVLASDPDLYLTLRHSELNHQTDTWPRTPEPRHVPAWLLSHYPALPRHTQTFEGFGIGRRVKTRWSVKQGNKSKEGQQRSLNSVAAWTGPLRMWEVF